MKYLITAHTDKGLIRENNEDNYIICPDLKNTDQWFFESNVTYKLSKSGFLLVVADGMGGESSGEIASSLAVQSIRNYFSTNPFINGNIRLFLKKAILYANDCILEYIKNNVDSLGMGTTLSLSWILNNKMYISWIGDSRIYLLRNEELIRLSKDHSFVQNLIDSGTISDEEAFYHPQNNIITQCLGQLSINPGYNETDLFNDDLILLCTDGLSAYVHDKIIQKICNNTRFDSLCETLVNESLLTGGIDNVTVISVKLQEILKTTANTQKKKLKSQIIRSIFIILISLSLLGLGIGIGWLYKAKNDDLKLNKEDSIKSNQVQKQPTINIHTDTLLRKKIDDSQKNKQVKLHTKEKKNYLNPVNNEREKIQKTIDSVAEKKNDEMISKPGKLTKIVTDSLKGGKLQTGKDSIHK